jgi:hypothetical protein
MTVRKQCVAAIGLVAWLGSWAGAQEVVPGGWSSRFSHQSLNGPGGAAGFAAVPGEIGFGGPDAAFGASAPEGYIPSVLNDPPPGYAAYPAASGIDPPPAFPQVMPPRPRTINATGGLIGVIQRSTRRSGR